MKLFTDKDIRSYIIQDGPREGEEVCYISANTPELLESPLVWQERGFQQTATGYGAKLTTTYKISFNGRLYRVYCTCYSNSGTCWFTAKGVKIIVS